MYNPETHTFTVELNEKEWKEVKWLIANQFEMLDAAVAIEDYGNETIEQLTEKRDDMQDLYLKFA